MSDPNWADVLGGVGQFVEAVVVVGGVLLARRELKRFKDTKRTEAEASTAGELWLAVSEAAELYGQLNKKSLSTGWRHMMSGMTWKSEYSKTEWEAAAKRISEALGRAIVRADLFHGENLLAEARKVHQAMVTVTERMASSSARDDSQEWRYGLATDEETKAVAESLGRIRGTLQPLATFK